MEIPFNRPYMTEKELKNIKQAYSYGHLSGNGSFTKKCNLWIERQIECRSAHLTHSGTAALEAAAMLADIKPFDEVIMPSYTFVSTANAFVLRGAVPVFVDIRPDTLNIDENKIEEAVTKKTKAIVPVHYAGVSCDMDKIMDIAARHNLIVIEDAAHGIMAEYKGRQLGSMGHIAALSFHETKNIISGEGGALIINDSYFAKRAEIILEKGTNRNRFFKGEVDKYSWVDIGSSFLPSELIAAFLWAQMEGAKNITARRLKIWNKYHKSFIDLEKKGYLRRPIVPEDCVHNAHMYYLLMKNLQQRDNFIKRLKSEGINTVFHYIPLHTSIAGRKYGRSFGNLQNTINLSERLVRLPFWIGMEKHLDYIVKKISNAVKKINQGIFV